VHYVRQLNLRFGSTNDDCVTCNISKTGDKFALGCHFQS